MHIECSGGPLDGDQVFVLNPESSDALAFPYPNGWYYLAPNINGVPLYRWDGEWYCAEHDAEAARKVRVVGR